MFTGLISALGEITQINAGNNVYRFTIKPDKNDFLVGDSISVNGVCLTIVEIKKNSLSFDVLSHTFNLTNLRTLKKGGFVNIEPALKASDRLGGHIVTGHIDTTATLLDITNTGEQYKLDIEKKCEFDNLLVKKGSIAVDGISLTIASVEKSLFAVYIIPHTFNHTNIKYRRKGDLINLEFDIISKYVAKFTGKYFEKGKADITESFLKEHGFI